MPPSSSYSSSPSTSRIIVAIIGVGLVLTVLLLVILLMFPGSRGLSIPGGYADGFRAARELAYQAGARPPDRLGSFSGTVTAVGGSSVTFTVNDLIADERVDGAGLVRTATVSNETQIVMLQERSNEEYASERAAYATARAVVESNPEADIPRPPSRFTEVTISLADIKVGDRVSVRPVPKTAAAAEGEEMVEALEGDVATYFGSKSFPALRIEVSRPEPEPVEAVEEAEPTTTVPPTPTPREEAEEDQEAVETAE